jgi:hypothetical protein
VPDTCEVETACPHMEETIPKNKTTKRIDLTLIAPLSSSATRFVAFLSHVPELTLDALERCYTR